MSTPDRREGVNVQAAARRLVEDERRRLRLPDNRAGRRAAERSVARKIAAHKRGQGATTDTPREDPR